jgi:predicted aminopeptidase
MGAALLAGCSSIGYYAQAVKGECSLLAARRPLVRVVADPATPPALKARLELAAAARKFAADRLDLPRNGSYTDYADIHRPFVVWNVFAAPEFSLEPLTHCFPVSGCVSYLGFFEQAAAEGRASQMHGNGYETYVGGVAAFSTLGWFDDPIISSMLRWDDDELAATIFHELSHQMLYVAGDTAFNESMATFVQGQALRQWHAFRGLPPPASPQQAREEAFTELVMQTRERLARLYASGEPPERLRAGKAAEIERLRQDYRQLRDTQWGGYRGYDAWMNAPINNAKLLPFGLYHRWAPAFAALYAQEGGDWPRFYAAARRMARLDQAAREAALQRLMPATAAGEP